MCSRDAGQLDRHSIERARVNKCHAKTDVVVNVVGYSRGVNSHKGGVTALKTAEQR